MFRFTIRDVLWLTVVVGLSVALWQSRAGMMREQKNAAAWSSKANAALHEIKSRVPEANWHGNGVVVLETHDNGINTLKVYHGK